ncbi:hypothetical protein B9Z65_6409 [Elsinoe australis]|uniref:Uncharacterized protein n=1 Tax=Elsinoe australis TaxID=40998 RepID=A0A2P8A8J3_9PEZI|nr:hypothetical protein B9Z65_6409 [Elsinoe australis]
MNQIESLSQPSFNHPYEIHHQQSPYAAPSPLAHQFIPPQSPVAPTQLRQPSVPQSNRPTFGHEFQGGHVQTKVQSPRNIVPGQNQSNQYTSAGLTQGIAAPVLSPTKQSTPPSQHTGSASPQKYPMAAPPLPASVRQHSPQTSNTSTSQPSSPQSAAHAGREKERVALLLDINLELLQEMNKLQANGKGGAPNPQQAAAMKAQGLSDKIAADEYIQVYYRVSANISYLYNQPDMQLLNPHNQGQMPQKKGPPHPPQFMWAPPHMASLNDKYAALRKLFPGWLGRDAPAGAIEGQQP